MAGVLVAWDWRRSLAGLWYALALSSWKRTLGADGLAGEVDIIEYPNLASNNLMALHTKEGCSVAGADQTGELAWELCIKRSPTNTPCSQVPSSRTTVA